MEPTVVERRLTKVETLVGVVKDDVAEIKSDVKVLLAAHAANLAANLAAAHDNGRIGVWFRQGGSWLIAIAALAFTVLKS